MTAPDAIARLIDREAIRDAMARYARAVDRGDWDGVRAAYHADGHDDHGGYRGGIDGLIDYLRRLLADATNGTHFLGNCLIEFAADDVALVETYFISERLVAHDGGAAEDRRCRLGWGRYLDRFERRDGAWRVARRMVVMDAVFHAEAVGAARGGASNWGARGADDPLAAWRAALLGDA